MDKRWVTRQDRSAQFTANTGSSTGTAAPRPPTDSYLQYRQAARIGIYGPEGWVGFWRPTVSHGKVGGFQLAAVLAKRKSPCVGHQL